MQYFDNYQDALEPTELHDPSGEEKPLDAGGDALPFDHLEDRRFEILAYRLKCAELQDLKHKIRLMQGTGERGRDILVYTSDGALAAIVQCKTYKDRVSAPLLIRELLKLALHAHLDPSVLGNGSVGYEL